MAGVYASGERTSLCHPVYNHITILRRLLEVCILSPVYLEILDLLIEYHQGSWMG